VKITKSTNAKYQEMTFKIIISLIAGLVISVRQIAINFIERIRFRSEIQKRWVPLGYTNVFAQNFMAHLRPSRAYQGSLIDLFSVKKSMIFETKANKIVFRGQKGKFQRQHFFREYESMGLPISSSVVLNQRFGGGNEFAKSRSEIAYEYVGELLESAFAMCPPGNYSNETFRFWESLLCGCLPVVANFVPSDPISNRRGTKLTEFRELVFRSEETCLKSELTSTVMNLIERWKEQRNTLNEHIKMS